MQRDGDSSPTGYFAVNNTIGYYYPKTDDLENETHLLVWISRAYLPGPPILVREQFTSSSGPRSLTSGIESKKYNAKGQAVGRHIGMQLKTQYSVVCAPHLFISRGLYHYRPLLIPLFSLDHFHISPVYRPTPPNPGSILTIKEQRLFL